MIAIFTVPGVPEPKGSTRAFVRRGRAVVVNDNPACKAWEEAIALSARRAMGARPPSEAQPVRVRLVFVMPRPQKHIGKKGITGAAMLALPHVKPDLDKLTRAALDPMTGIVFDDDARVVKIDALKRYPAPRELPHLEVEVFDAREG